MVVMLAGAILLGVNAAAASSVELSFSVPSSVNAGVPFSITVYVTNHSPEAITFNKAAAGYLLADMKIKGPYEVFNQSYTVDPGQQASFSFNFKIFYGSGTIVPVAVFLAQDSYQGNNMRGAGVVAVNVK